MKTKAVVLVVGMGALFFMSTKTFAQSDNSPETRVMASQVDKGEEDKSRLKDAKELKRSTKAEAKMAKATAKEASRIEDDASDAAKQARQAARREIIAQKSRNNADEQARKAAEATEKSNNN
ncbi:hypothetical protein [Adhaeribacter pallidiroseus]|uniref:Uncharacterized protein n=1 Tax=Adhaeribacter pallidiroseus TaxID=2072847 RepID=A0A369QVW4_9BACT|nr:hypothetical protein [Adhaeribacter pallidiroseus]RDC66308.1 hypothetical protein AHMF7616_04939 [Adhaeribacter pallidiroseus]